jgi:ribosomal protein S27AE
MLAPSGNRGRKTIVPPPSIVKKGRGATIKSTLCLCGGLFVARKGTEDLVCGSCGRTRAR